MPFSLFGGTLARDCGLGYEDGYPGPTWKQISREVSEAPEPSVALGRELDKICKRKILIATHRVTSHCPLCL